MKIVISTFLPSAAGGNSMKCLYTHTVKRFEEVKERGKDNEKRTVKWETFQNCVKKLRKKLNFQIY